MTPPSPAVRRNPAYFLAPDRESDHASPRLSVSSPARHTEVPRPVIVQRRSRTARYARFGAVARRVSIVMMTDILVLISVRELLHFLRSPHAPSEAMMKFLLESIPRGTFPRIQLVVAILIGLAIFRNYGSGPRRRHTRRIVAASLLGLSLICWRHIWTAFSPITLFGCVLSLTILSLALITGRKVLDAVIRHFRPQPEALERAIIVAAPERASAVMRASPLRNDSRIELVGFVSPLRTPGSNALGTVHDLVWLLDRHDIDTIILADILDEELLTDVLELAHNTGCTILRPTPLYPIGGFVPEIVHRGHIPYVQIHKPRLCDAELVLKRMFDTATAAILVILFSPILAAVAIAVRLSSPGPILFRQKRVGHCGRLFDMYKFRSMVQDAEQRKDDLAALNIYGDGRLFKVKDDPRITPVGRFLRRSSLDELPQLWNVLRGDMSLVGPRPPLATEVEKYEEYHYTRFDMRPGITGLWQISGRSNVTSFDDIIAMDADYLTGWSIMKDITILFKTIPAVLTMRGAT